jgi:hypothetical protein
MRLWLTPVVDRSSNMLGFARRHVDTWFRRSRDRTDVQVLLSAQQDTGDRVQFLSALRLKWADIQDKQRTTFKMIETQPAERPARELAKGLATSAISGRLDQGVSG